MLLPCCKLLNKSCYSCISPVIGNSILLKALSFISKSLVLSLGSRIRFSIVLSSHELETKTCTHYQNSS